MDRYWVPIVHPSCKKLRSVSLCVLSICFELHCFTPASTHLLSLDDLVIGAPMFMRRESCGRLEELGKVYVYLQMGPLQLEPGQSHLLGPQAFSRFGTSLAPLGDLNQDGFNGKSDTYHASKCYTRKYLNSNIFLTFYSSFNCSNFIL